MRQVLSGIFASNPFDLEPIADILGAEHNRLTNWNNALSKRIRTPEKTHVTYVFQNTPRGLNSMEF